MDSVIYALVLGPALAELLPRSGYAAAPADIAFAGSLMFALFLVGWGLSFIWGPIADRFGRTKSLAATVLVYAVFTGAAAFAPNVWVLALFRFLAGIGVGGEWAMAGTYVAEAWPEDRRKMGAGYLQTGYYFGFFVAAALNFTVGASSAGARCSCAAWSRSWSRSCTLAGVKEPERWEHRHEEQVATHRRRSPARRRSSQRQYLRTTLVMSGLLTVAIIGLWAGAVYEPTAHRVPVAPGRDGAARGRADGVLRHRAALDRHHPGLHRRAVAGGAAGAGGRRWPSITPACW